MVSFRRLEVQDITKETRAVATPLAADNQWAPLDLLRGQSNKFSLFKPTTWLRNKSSIAETRNYTARIEIARSLLDTSKIIINRASIYNHPVFQSWLLDGTDEDRNALSNLIAEDSLIIFYINENEPLQWPDFHIRRDNEFKSAWTNFVNRFVAFPGLKLAWGLAPSEENELVRNQLTRPFVH